jgi:DNA-binding transcriptional LysR family regulator
MLNALEARIHAAGLEPRFEHFAGLSSSVHASVAAGIAYALLPRLAIDVSDPRVTAIDLDEMFPPRRLVLYWNRHRRLNSELVAFCESLRDTCASLDRPPRVDGATAVAAA